MESFLQKILASDADSQGVEDYVRQTRWLLRCGLTSASTRQPHKFVKPLLEGTRHSTLFKELFIASLGAESLAIAPAMWRIAPSKLGETGVSNLFDLLRTAAWDTEPVHNFILFAVECCRQYPQLQDTYILTCAAWLKRMDVGRQRMSFRFMQLKCPPLAYACLRLLPLSVIESLYDTAAASRADGSELPQVCSDIDTKIVACFERQSQLRYAKQDDMARNLIVLLTELRDQVSLAMGGCRATPVLMLCLASVTGIW